MKYTLHHQRSLFKSFKTSVFIIFQEKLSKFSNKCFLYYKQLFLCFFFFFSFKLNCNTYKNNISIARRSFCSKDKNPFFFCFKYVKISNNETSPTDNRLLVTRSSTRQTTPTISFEIRNWTESRGRYKLAPCMREEKPRVAQHSQAHIPRFELASILYTRRQRKWDIYSILWLLRHFTIKQ